ncbi:uracil-DNA glycosylase family protein [Aneurinibacillus sp. Ricciae_BoGa-3]|uniref:uracil-DNA glycosylase family protein n=1 Tax=Aneurinibacillus sp. Ricciae_BoGa-3 TaxID=3022697 RepID=UPI002341CCD8|nr:uracil-DNA glycosylase family protein [Aneurinibacillus sp. Ricciae_BoGa-3]WCK54167.1 uracil-DNA glycosylase family protein [Aneurinibacillus sp. Ricciae_BoGa-3]
MIDKLKQLNFTNLIKITDEDVSNYSFNNYRQNGFKHNIHGFCTSCEEKNINSSLKSLEYKLSTISHGTHTIDFVDAININKPDISSWNEQSVMFIFESPSKINETYESITYEGVKKMPVKEWYWIHRDRTYKEFPQHFEGKHYGNLVLSIINTFKLKNAYVTNLVKCGLNNDQGEFKGIEYYPSECIHNCFNNFLKQEIEIVQPEVIFAFSKNVHKWVKNLMPHQHVYYLPHPAGRTKNKVRKMFYFWEVAQGLYNASIIGEEEIGELAIKYISNGSKCIDNNQNAGT